MVKYARRSYYANKKRNYGGFLKAISRYHYTKLSSFGQILLDNGGIKFGVNNSQILQANTVLGTCSDWEGYHSLFLTYKIRGIKVTLVPNKDQAVDFRGTAAFGYVANSDGATVAETVESNKSLLLNPNQQTSAYWPLSGGLTGWVPSNSANLTTGKFQCTSTANAAGGGIVWSYKIDFYIMFKNTV